jgi:hypothetical protein
VVSIVQGKTPCRICGLVLVPSEEGDIRRVGGLRGLKRPVEALPFAVFDSCDALYSVGGGSVHSDCLDRSGVAEMARWMRGRHIAGPSKLCVVCGAEAAASAALSVRCVTSDEANALFPANYVSVHESCFSRWSLGPALEELCGDPRWVGPRIVRAPRLRWDPNWQWPGGQTSVRKWGAA